MACFSFKNVSEERREFVWKEKLMVGSGKGKESKPSKPCRSMLYIELWFSGTLSRTESLAS